jgi:hypothetical protein
MMIDFRGNGKMENFVHSLTVLAKSPDQDYNIVLAERLIGEYLQQIKPKPAIQLIALYELDQALSKIAMTDPTAKEFLGLVREFLSLQIAKLKAIL